MASKASFCGTCTFLQLSKPSVVWCCECDEGFCVECTKHHASAKATRNHDTVPMSKFQKLPSDILKVSTFCGEHKEKYNMYCKKHDCPCCRRCMVGNHIECKDICILEDVIKGAKSSNAFLEIENVLTELADNIGQFRKDRKKNLISLQEERENIVKEIHQTRMKINSHLDKVQEEMIKDVHESEKKESATIRTLLSQLEQKETAVKELQQTLANLKFHASDLQTYLGMKQIDKDVAAAENAIKTIFRDSHSKQVTLTCQIDPVLQNLSGSIQKFGKVVTESQESKFTVISKKDKQAQIEITGKPSYDSISLQLKQTFNVESSDISGCSILPDGSCVICCWHECRLVVVKPDGTKDFLISCAAFDVAYIAKSNSLAVTGGRYYVRHIKLVDLKDKKEVQSIDGLSCSDGITVHDDTLLICAGDKGIRQLNLQDNNVKDIVKIDLKNHTFIASHKDNIYYTQRNNDCIICCDIRGTEKWKFSEPNILRGPTGISVDGNGNVFVAGFTSHNVIVISADGQNCRQLLSAKDGVNKPKGMHYDQSTNKLLIANKNYNALLFDVVKV